MDMAQNRTDWDDQFGRARIEFQRFLGRAGAATAILLDTSGNCVTYFGEDPEFDLALFASLAVGDYLATQEIANLLGEESLRWVVHQGRETGLILAPSGPLLLLAVIFDHRTTLGLVRHEMKKDWSRLGEALAPLAEGLERQIQERDGAFELDQEIGLEPVSALGDEAADDPALREGFDRLFGPSN